MPLVKTIDQMLNTLVDYPDIWGEGALFAYSGMDGVTNSNSQYVATLAQHPYSLLIHTPCRAPGSRGSNCQSHHQHHQ